MKRVLAGCLSLMVFAVASLGIASAATALVTVPVSDTGPNGEKAVADMSLTPKSGSLYQGGFVAADWTMHATVTAPYTGPTQDIFPLKEIHLKLPTDMTFKPDPKMPVCTDAKMNKNTNLSIPPQNAIAICPKSVIGNGTAALYLGHKNLPGGPGLKDPVLIAFNAGLQNGQPKIKIYGFSKGTGVGIFIEGVLKPDGTLTLMIPELSSDSAVGEMTLNIPGPKPIQYNYRTVPESVGQDPDYLQAKCSTGTWKLTSEFVLGTRDSAGQPISNSYPVTAPDFSAGCVGKPGKPGKPAGVKIARVRVFPNKATRRAGQILFLQVRIVNQSSASGWVKVKLNLNRRKGVALRSAIRVYAKPNTFNQIKVPFRITRRASGRYRVTAVAQGKRGTSTITVRRAPKPRR